MDSSFWFDKYTWGSPLYNYLVQDINKKYCFILSEDMFTFTNSVDPYEMQHFIWVFTVCKSTHLGVSRVQWANICYNKSLNVIGCLCFKSNVLV